MKLINYEILSIRKKKFKDCNIENEFFNSLKDDYPKFKQWFLKKAENEVYTHYDSEGNIQGFLYLKEEDETECYNDMEHPLPPMRRLKIGTFKISENGYYMGERFFKVIFENAIRNNFNEIYVTIFSHHDQLILYLERFGFKQTTKLLSTGELVFVRNLQNFEDNFYQGYPILNTIEKNFFLLPIRPEYHTKLLPDAILKTEDNKNYIDNNKAGNTLKKVYFGKNLWKHKPNNGDIVFFYRTKDHSNASPAHYQSVLTSIGVVSNYGMASGLSLSDLDKLLTKCVLETSEISQIKNPNNKYRFLEFTYFGKLDYRAINLAYLREHDIEAPRGLAIIPNQIGYSILKESRYSEGIVIK
ncbi:hypothetical protein [Vagococcus acidifermentans]|uniref:N-acetyltransferase domain-containing protein n=1 Tax=Vagococcus acidifermentans TaxID=564710 RepID=A0A430AP09_9ENTE|nr:hypothetical protein [Vagococcus acidifermentans]RSU09796.1 hypothetical protein CBF27_11975 [Vagococcus acidifermentans]